MASDAFASNDGQASVARRRFPWRETSMPADDGVVRFKLIDGKKISVRKIARANRNRNGSATANAVGTTNSTAITFLVMADTRYDLPHTRRPPSAESGKISSAGRR